MFVYAELYNLNFEGGPTDSFLLNYRILNRDGSLFHNYGEIIENKPGSSAVITNVLRLNGIGPGRYELSLIAHDFMSETADTALRRFIIFPESGDLAPIITQISKHPYDTASITTRMNLVKYLMAPQQLAMLETLNDTGKIRFIDQFFEDNDPDPSTVRNEYLDDAFSRFIYANENFSTLPETNDGWKMDRGRVMMQYGVWSERKEIPTPAFGKPWEKWTFYSLEGGSIFIFQDIDGYGDYRLVHSTVKGEIYSAAWEQILKDIEPLLQD
jgi:GWxTD domain-containing protein